VFILGVSLCFYFSYLLIQGERSYGRLIGLESAIERGTVDLGRLQAERDDMQTRVEMLRPGSINHDYLEERARAMIGYRAPGETDMPPAPDKSP
jgi:cell division protein FtsB